MFSLSPLWEMGGCSASRYCPREFIGSDKRGEQESRESEDGAGDGGKIGFEISGIRSPQDAETSGEYRKTCPDSSEINGAPSMTCGPQFWDPHCGKSKHWRRGNSRQAGVRELCEGYSAKLSSILEIWNGVSSAEKSVFEYCAASMMYGARYKGLPCGGGVGPL
jgi:hypothetical protein